MVVSMERSYDQCHRIMKRNSNQLWLLNATVVSLIGLLAAMTDDDIPSIHIALKLVLLRNYEKEVISYGASSPTMRFVDKARWETILHTRLENKIFKGFESHWNYILMLTNEIEPDKVALLTVFQIKIIALKQAASYLLCVRFLQSSQFRIILEHCKSLAAHLLIFSQLGTAELLTSLSSCLENVKKFDANIYKESLNQFVNYSRKLFTGDIQIAHVLEVDAMQIDELEFKRLSEEVKLNATFLYKVGIIKIKVLGVGKDIQFSEKRKLDFTKESEMYLWENSKYSIQNLILGHVIRSSTKFKYGISNFMSENIIRKAELENVTRRQIAEKFDHFDRSYLHAQKLDCYQQKKRKHPTV